VAPDEFIVQSLKLGLDLASMALEARPFIAKVLFEERPREYDIDFSPRPLSAVKFDESAFDFEVMMLLTEDEDTEGKNLIVPIEPELLIAVKSVAIYFDATRIDFLHSSTFFRDRWSMTQPHRGEIFVDNGTEEGLFLSSPLLDNPLPPEGLFTDDYPEDTI
jgi:hypothetical protein